MAKYTVWKFGLILGKVNKIYQFEPIFRSFVPTSSSTITFFKTIGVLNFSEGTFLYEEVILHIYNKKYHVNYCLNKATPVFIPNFFTITTNVLILGGNGESSTISWDHFFMSCQQYYNNLRQDRPIPDVTNPFASQHHHHASQVCMFCYFKIKGFVLNILLENCIDLH